MAISKCAACGIVFTGVKAFDAHQIVDYTEPEPVPVACLPPSLVGLVQDSQCRWGFTDGEAVKAKMAKARAARKPKQLELPAELLDGFKVTKDA
jgi:hypothetical protein